MLAVVLVVEYFCHMNLLWIYNFSILLCPVRVCPCAILIGTYLWNTGTKSSGALYSEK